MSADHAKIKAIKKTPSSMSIEEVKSFINMYQYNSYFIGQAREELSSDVSAPLRHLLYKGEEVGGLENAKQQCRN